MCNVMKYFVASVVMLVTMVGCIKNDIPRSVEKIEVLSFEAEGLLSPATINNSEHTISLSLDEITDIRNVEITSMTLTQGATTTLTIPGCYDLRMPLYMTLSKSDYQWDWTITAEQSVERYFEVEGQIGEAQIDALSHVATVLVPMDYDLKSVVITRLKLGPRDITEYSEEPATLTDFEDSARLITITYHNDIVENWTLRVIPTDVEVEFKGVDAWAKRIWLYAEGRSGADLGFNYRKAGDEEWIAVEDITVNGGSFSACVADLEPLTEYEVVAFSGENYTDVIKATTEDIFTLPNAGLEEWSTTDGVVYPYAAGGVPFWATGNDGAALASTTLTEPVSDTRPGSEGIYAASLQSKKAAIMGIGKFAAGNLFLGEFGGLVGMDGLVNFGRPCSARPVALHGWVKYNCGTIDEVGKIPSARPDLKKGDNDEGQILIAVGNWTAAEYGGSENCPVVVNTKDESTFFNKNGKDVIGVGEMLLSESTDGWIEFTLPLEYRSTSEIPTHIIMVFTGSHFGDYFTGSTFSQMLVDDLELIY